MDLGLSTKPLQKSRSGWTDPIKRISTTFIVFGKADAEMHNTDGCPLNLDYHRVKDIDLKLSFPSNQPGKDEVVKLNPCQRNTISLNLSLTHVA